MATIWTNEMIEADILEVSRHIGNNLMPTRTDIHDFYGNDRLTNKISKTLGYYGWAKKLGLTVQDNDTSKAKKVEREVCELLSSKGFSVEMMLQNYPYDLLVDGILKIDVKVSALYKSPQMCEFYSFALRKKKPTCDIYILVARDGGNADKFYVIPSFKVQQLQISIGKHQSKYDIYLNKFSILDEYLHRVKTIS